MFDSKSPFSVLRIERLELLDLHSLQPLQVFGHLRAGFRPCSVLGWPCRRANIRPIPPSLRRSTRTREGLVDIARIGTDATFLVLKPHEVSGQLFGASRSGEVNGIQERDLTITNPADNELLNGNELVVTPRGNCSYWRFRPMSSGMSTREGIDGRCGGSVVSSAKGTVDCLLPTSSDAQCRIGGDISRLGPSRGRPSRP